MQIKNWLAMTACALLTAAAVTACGTGANNAGNATPSNNTTSATAPPPKTYTGKVVATYQGGDVKKDELDQLYNLLVVLPGYDQQETKSQFLTYYTTMYRYMYDQAAGDTSVKVDVAKARQLADQSISQLVGQKYKTKNDVTNAMKSLGVSEDDLVRLAIKGQYVQTYVDKETKKTPVSDAAAKTYYDQHLADFTTVTVNHILVKTLPEAQKVEAELKAGADIAKTADKYSTDPGVKDNHGKYADQTAGQFVPEFAQACVKLPIGKISDPVHTQFGYHVMRVDKRTTQPFAAAKAQIVQQLESQEQQTIYNNAMKAAKIKVVAKESEL